MGAVATFSFPDFISAYPGFSTVPSSLLQQWFNIAGLYWRNDGTGPVPDVPTQTTLMYMLTAHVTQLYQLNQSGTALLNPLVGRINSAGEGSVNVGTDYSSTPSSQWFDQTTFGAAFWQVTSAYRTMRYRPKAGRYFGVFYPNGRG